MNIEGTAAVITGGGNGIGKAIALALAKQGVSIAIADIELAAATATSDEIKADGGNSFALQVDVTQEAQLQALADEAWKTFGSVELLFNNAGILLGRANLFDVSAADVRWMLAVNIEGVLNGIRVFAPRFIAANKSARILNTGSEHSLGVPHVGAGIYTATKHAILGLSDVLRRELPEHVGVSVLCPGLVQSTLWRSEERRTTQQKTVEALDPTRGKFSETFGMPAEEVADRVIKGIETDKFLIPTHAHVVDSASQRWQEISQAFDEQAPRYEGDGQYDVEKLIEKLTN
ncbi:MAG: SDR family NAD(P)-dependent oxidoreductase [Pseudomonadota bacterium]